MLDIMILQSEQGRAEKLEDRLFTINGTIRTLLSREAQLEYRLKHIENELASRNILNRQEGERILRDECRMNLTRCELNVSA